MPDFLFSSSQGQWNVLDTKEDTSLVWGKLGPIHLGSKQLGPRHQGSKNGALCLIGISGDCFVIFYDVWKQNCNFRKSFLCLGFCILYFWWCILDSVFFLFGWFIWYCGQLILYSGGHFTFRWVFGDSGDVISSDRSSYGDSVLQEIHQPVVEIWSISANIFSFSFRELNADW